jgi:hypothetical protein
MMIIDDFDDCDIVNICCRWAWEQIDIDGNGMVSKKEIYRLMKKYNQHVADNVNILRLIRKCDKNEDRILVASEIQSLLTVLPLAPDSHSRATLQTTHTPESATSKSAALHPSDPPRPHPAPRARRRARQAACGAESADDASAVMARVEAMARATTHDGYDPNSTTALSDSSSGIRPRHDVGPPDRVQGPP